MTSERAASTEMPADDSIAPDDLPPEERPLWDTVEEFVAAGKALVASELAFASARAAIIASAGRTIAICGVLVLVLLLATIVTLMVGGVLVLQPIMGIGLALLAIIATAVMLMLACGAAIKAQIARIKAIPK